MKTIEERAKEYVEKHRSVESCYFTPEGSYSYHAERVAYEVGATEQKAIDDAVLLKLKSAWEKQAQINHDDELNYQQGYHDAIEKACKVCKNELRRLKQLINESVGIPANLVSEDKSLSRIRLEMYEND